MYIGLQMPNAPLLEALDFYSLDVICCENEWNMDREMLNHETPLFMLSNNLKYVTGGGGQKIMTHITKKEFELDQLHCKCINNLMTFILRNKFDCNKDTDNPMILNELREDVLLNQECEIMSRFYTEVIAPYGNHVVHDMATNYYAQSVIKDWVAQLYHSFIIKRRELFYHNN